MPIEPADLAWMREWIGSTPDDATLEERLAVYDGVRSLTVLGVLRTRRADLLADPLSYSIRGDVTVNATANLAALESLIASLEAVAVADGDLEASDLATLSGATLERVGTWGRGYPTGEDPGWHRLTS